MTGISLSTDITTMNLAVYNASQTQQTINTLTAQGSSGYISSDYAGLGANVGQALDLTSQLAANSADQSNATQAANIQTVAQTALGQIQSLASSFSSQLLSPSANSYGGLTNLATSAKNALTQLANLLDSKVGNVYIFAGQDSSNPPVPDPDNITSSAFVTAIQTAVAGLDANGAAATQTQLLTTAGPGTTSPFSATLEASNGAASADLGNGQTVQLSVLADQNTDALSSGTGTTSTGSYTRDIFMALATISSLGSASTADPQVQTLLANVQTTLSGADTAINTDIAGLGARQNTITNAQSDLTATATALTTQLGNVQDADPATVATQLATAQNQLQASYKIIADLEQLTLAKYI